MEQIPTDERIAAQYNDIRQFHPLNRRDTTDTNISETENLIERAPTSLMVNTSNFDAGSSSSSLPQSAIPEQPSPIAPIHVLPPRYSDNFGIQVTLLSDIQFNFHSIPAAQENAAKGICRTRLKEWADRTHNDWHYVGIRAGKTAYSLANVHFRSTISIGRGARL